MYNGGTYCMMWTLILTTVLHSPYYRQSSTMTTVVIPGFASETLCSAAGYNAPKPSGGKEEYIVEKKWSCVPMGDPNE